MKDYLVQIDNKQRFKRNRKEKKAIPNSNRLRLIKRVIFARFSSSSTIRSSYSNYYLLLNNKIRVNNDKKDAYFIYYKKGYILINYFKRSNLSISFNLNFYNRNSRINELDTTLNESYTNFDYQKDLKNQLPLLKTRREAKQ